MRDRTRLAVTLGPSALLAGYGPKGHTSCCVAASDASSVPPGAQAGPGEITFVAPSPCPDRPRRAGVERPCYDRRMPQDDRARTPADIPVPEMERLLSLALSRGGSFADLYFEHETTSSLLLEEGIIRTASAGVSCGLGVRVVSGERTGYA